MEHVALLKVQAVRVDIYNTTYMSELIDMDNAPGDYGNEIRMVLLQFSINCFVFRSAIRG